MNQTLRATSDSDQYHLQLIQGDITGADVKAIVNPANSQLMHGGGLAGLLSRKAGPKLQEESAGWVRKHGPVSHQSPAYTGAGKLPFKYIIHAVGPVWGSGEEETKLDAAVQGSLKVAEELELSSLALPAISTGVFRYPVQEAARVILSTIKNHVENKKPGNLKGIQVFVYDDQSADIFSQIWDSVFS
jgi:O-acetyl-ADP-ribose deacetylase (regulator of RNase III)